MSFLPILESFLRYFDTTKVSFRKFPIHRCLNLKIFEKFRQGLVHSVSLYHLLLQIFWNPKIWKHVHINKLFHHIIFSSETFGLESIRNNFKLCILEIISIFVEVFLKWVPLKMEIIAIILEIFSKYYRKCSNKFVNHSKFFGNCSKHFGNSHSKAASGRFSFKLEGT